MKLVDDDTSLFEEEQAARFKVIIDGRRRAEQHLLEAQAVLADSVIQDTFQPDSLALIDLLHHILAALQPPPQ